MQQSTPVISIPMPKPDENFLPPPTPNWLQDPTAHFGKPVFSLYFRPSCHQLTRNRKQPFRPSAVSNRTTFRVQPHFYSGRLQQSETRCQKHQANDVSFEERN